MKIKLKLNQGYLDELLRILKATYPNTKSALNYGSEWEFLVAVVLSAQCTDKRVNIVTQTLFKKYKTIEDYADANAQEFEKDISSINFFRNKAKNIQKAARIIINKYNGKVPKTMKELNEIPGVGRKTANVIIGTFNESEGVVVDTHVRRLSQRLGLTKYDDPKKIEEDLMKLFPREEWHKLSLRLIDHGRAICVARNPKCAICPLNKICPSAFKFSPKNNTTVN